MNFGFSGGGVVADRSGSVLGAGIEDNGGGGGAISVFKDRVPFLCTEGGGSATASSSVYGITAPVVLALPGIVPLTIEANSLLLFWNLRIMRFCLGTGLAAGDGREIAGDDFFEIAGDACFRGGAGDVVFDVCDIGDSRRKGDACLGAIVRDGCDGCGEGSEL